MSYFAITVERKLKRMSALRESYENLLANLPKGSLRVKERNGKKYFYLSYRRDGKVVSDYVGNNEDTLDGLKEQLRRRKGIEKLLKKINNELRLISKALEVAK